MHNRTGNSSEYITNFLRLKKVIPNKIKGSNYYEFENTVSDAKVVCLLAESKESDNNAINRAYLKVKPIIVEQYRSTDLLNFTDEVEIWLPTIDEVVWPFT